MFKSYQHHFQTIIIQWQNTLLAGEKWTYLFFAWTSAITALFLFATVHSRPIEEVLPHSFRIEHILTLWHDYGFFNLAGLGYSESPTVNPQALVYRSRPPAFLYPLYLMNAANEAITGEPFSFRLYVWYPQIVHWLAAASLGFLGFRMSRRIGITPFFALIYGIIGQNIFHTFPRNLEWYFEPLPEQFTCLLLIFFLILEECEFDTVTRKTAFFSHLTIFLLIYLDKGLAIPALATYLLSKMLIGTYSLRTFTRIGVPGTMGLLVHGLQLLWVSRKFPSITFVGSTFLYRSGLDGATNHVNLLTPANLGSTNLFLRNAAFIALLAILVCLARYQSAQLKSAFLLATLPINVYLISGYFLSQWAMIHPYLHDIFLSVAAVMILCFLFAPYLESLTGNTGVVTWALFIVGFCLCMYQLRLFAIAHPLPIPEPDWRAYRYFG